MTEQQPHPAASQKEEDSSPPQRAHLDDPALGWRQPGHDSVHGMGKYVQRRPGGCYDDD